jgi:hypothetical protein
VSPAIPSIAFLIPYFGSWPFWMPFFLESCRRNPDIHWWLFSDCGIPENLPSNVKVEPISFKEYCLLVSKQLGIRFDPTAPYKLCDIKPALGYIHAEHLAGYDFWAFGDLDVIYGDLRSYFTAERLSRYDLFSTHARRVSGHLCMIRNNPCGRELFMKVPQWQERFCEPTHFAFDEQAFSRVFIKRKNLPKLLYKLAGKLNPLRRRSKFSEQFSTPGGAVCWHDGTKDFPLTWYWRDGHLTNDLNGDRTYLYFHFAIWKRDTWSMLSEPDPTYVKKLAQEAAWQIDKSGFLSLERSENPHQ